MNENNPFPAPRFNRVVLYDNLVDIAVTYIHDHEVNPEYAIKV